MMKNMALLVTILTIFLCSCSTIKTHEVMVVTDIHVDYLYDLAESVLASNEVLKDNLKYPQCLVSDTSKPYIGKYGCDPTEKLMEIYLDQLAKEARQRDAKAIIFLGDLAPHKTNLKVTSNISDQDTEEILYHLKTMLYNLSRKYFGQIYNSEGDRMPVYMHIGNHDTLISYESPEVQTSKYTRDYLEFLNDLYLDGEDSMAMGQYDKNRSLYKEIGCYVVKDIFNIDQGQVPHDEYVSLISFNTLLMEKQAVRIYDHQAKTALKWLEEVLKTSPHNEKFILSQHIPPGIFVYNDENEVFLKDSSDPSRKKSKNPNLNFAFEYQAILEKYSSKILISIAGHSHTLKLSLPLYYHTAKTDSILQVQFGSFTPVSYNNILYYSLKFSSSDGADGIIGLDDIVSYEVDLTEMVTREKSLYEYIISDLFPIKNREMAQGSNHSLWVDRFLAVIDLLKKPNTDVEMYKSYLQKYLMFTVGHQNSTYEIAQKAINDRIAINLASPYAKISSRKSLYCSCLTLTVADYTGCMNGPNFA